MALKVYTRKEGNVTYRWVENNCLYCTKKQRKYIISIQKNKNS